MKKNNNWCNKFYLEGLNVERFLNQLIESKIRVYNLKRIDFNKIEFDVSFKDVRKIEKLSKNFNFKVEKASKGIFSIISFLKNRLGIAIGIVLSICLVAVANQFTFNFSILGLENIDKTKIEEVLKNHGIDRFKINKFDANEIESILSNEIPEISMVSVIKKGTTIIVNIKEKLPNLEDSYQPIIAEHNMLITGLEVYSGFTNLKIGDSILKGETLVYPYSFDGNNNPIPCEPKAKIEALTWFSASVRFCENEKKLVRTGEKQIFENSYFFGKNEVFKRKNEILFENYEMEEMNEQISYLFLPIGVNKKIAHELKEVEIKHNFEEEKDGLIKSCLESAYIKVPSNILIEDEKVVLSNDGDGIIISVYLQASIILGEN